MEPRWRLDAARLAPPDTTSWRAVVYPPDDPALDVSAGPLGAR